MDKSLNERSLHEIGMDVVIMSRKIAKGDINVLTKINNIIDRYDVESVITLMSISTHMQIEGEEFITFFEEHKEVPLEELKEKLEKLSGREVVRRAKVYSYTSNDNYEDVFNKAHELYFKIKPLLHENNLVRIADNLQPKGRVITFTHSLFMPIGIEDRIRVVLYEDGDLVIRGYKDNKIIRDITVFKHLHNRHEQIENLKEVLT